jgi:hypothetical protein
MNLSKEGRYCYAQAKACARKAEDALTDEGRSDFLYLKETWLTVARSYELPQATNSTRP